MLTQGERDTVGKALAILLGETAAFVKATVALRAVLGSQPPPPAPLVRGDELVTFDAPPPKPECKPKVKRERKPARAGRSEKPTPEMYRCEECGGLMFARDLVEHLSDAHNIMSSVSSCGEHYERVVDKGK